MADAIHWSSHEEGINDLEAFFEYAGAKARDMREPLHRTRDYITTIIEGQFATEGGLRSGGWEPLTEDYALWKDENFPGPILELDPVALLDGEHGTPPDMHMRDVLLNPAAWVITRTEADYEPPSSRAAWHQEGAERGTHGGTLPPRPPLELNDEDYESIEDMFERWLDELRGANPRRSGAAALPSIFS